MTTTQGGGQWTAMLTDDEVMQAVRVLTAERDAALAEVQRLREALFNLGFKANEVLAHMEEEVRNPDYRWHPVDYAADLRAASDKALKVYAARALVSPP